MQRLLLFVLAVLAFPVLSNAQGARSQLNGTVTDSTGAVVVGAPVVATALETQVKSKTATTRGSTLFRTCRLAATPLRSPPLASARRPQNR
jgi:hypothetical protein